MIVVKNKIIHVYLSVQCIGSTLIIILYFGKVRQGISDTSFKKNEYGDKYHVCDCVCFLQFIKIAEVTMVAYLIKHLAGENTVQFKLCKSCYKLCRTDNYRRWSEEMVKHNHEKPKKLQILGPLTKRINLKRVPHRHIRCLSREGYENVGRWCQSICPEFAKIWSEDSNSSGHGDIKNASTRWLTTKQLVDENNHEIRKVLEWSQNRSVSDDKTARPKPIALCIMGHIKKRWSSLLKLLQLLHVSESGRHLI